jgi:hypothetical protein
MELFGNLNRVWVETLAVQFFNNFDNWKAFKGSVKDLMVSMRSFSSQKDEFYEHQMKLEKEKAIKKEQDKKNMIPGMKSTP